jgi:hypothetical protein
LGKKIFKWLDQQHFYQETHFSLVPPPAINNDRSPGTPELGCPLPGGARGAKVPFQFKGLPWQNSELSEMLVQFFYEFASENARNVVIELQE